MTGLMSKFVRIHLAPARQVAQCRGASAAKYWRDISLDVVPLQGGGKP